jgi:hypothetical protein
MYLTKLRLPFPYCLVEWLYLVVAALVSIPISILRVASFGFVNSGADLHFMEERTRYFFKINRKLRGFCKTEDED